ncbi:MAG: YggS family pyridoxal phosphate-dependent enzyme [Opitutales bacterium]|nr:YggS family pyridoxal phosphate-dependent enzyme [Opitutales bacterium]MCH8539295.1 YggS family pyridoxal phosphate-dependent enzyme [Opitutales bacterium]
MEKSKLATLKKKQEMVQARVVKACEAASRSPSEVEIMAVSKTHPLSRIAAAGQLGWGVFGENRVQEAKEKIEQADFTARWELIGHLQSNKAGAAVRLFDRIQSVDSLKLARRLDRLAEEAGHPQRILLQVNTGRDEGKFGVLPEDVAEVVDFLATAAFLRWEGFMTIAPLEGGRSRARQAFADLREMAARIRVETSLPLPVLSMGMSGDLEEAILEGSTQVRIGSALFGEREA